MHKQKFMIVWILACSVLSGWQLSTCAADLLSSLRILPSLLMLKPPNVVIQEVRRLAPEMFVTFEEDVRAKGYPVETHKVRTEDGYILTVHRIPRGREDITVDETKEPRPAVLLQHGMFGNSHSFAFLEHDVSPGLLLADRGYDVWVGNIRGTTNSLKHETLKRKDPRFWKFSWHEVGYYDVPAIIDHILHTTSQDKLFYVGHSMGCTVFFVAMSMRPEYNAKIRLGIALAPGVFFDGSQNSVAKLLESNFQFFQNHVESNPDFEVCLHGDVYSSFYYLFCGEQSFFNKMCAVVVSWIMGIIDLNDTAKIGVLLSTGFGSTSSLVPWHFIQIIKADDFILRDDGEEENMIKYGSKQPPKYPLNKVTTPVALVGAVNDTVTPPKGVKRLSRTLPNTVFFKIIEENFFNHLGYITHPKVLDVQWKELLELMKQY